TLRRGETVGQLFARQGLGSLDLSDLARIGFDPRRLQPGLIFNFKRSTHAIQPSEVQVRTSPEERFRMWHAAGNWNVERQEIPWTVDRVVVGGIIGSTLYDGLDAGVADDVLDGGDRMKLAWDLADVYAWSVDFSRDLQPGDRFAAVVERRVSPDGDVRYRRILAATLELSGNAQTALRFAQGGPDSFYDPSGRSLRRAFLAAPVEFRRISSTFSRARFHPVLRRYRAHAGVDYAANSGTPVMAAGDGTILSAGRSGGYGIMVEIRHRNGVSTRYAHLRGAARGISPGKRVTQGQVIGYVGSTGLSTAPHLHYEFRVNGAPRDPRRVQMPAGPPVAKAARGEFDRLREEYARLLVLPSPQPIRVAD
ncbi:MAG TPA: M23 family metallopeptidase, partial [Gemmatimonadales bacterium]